MLRYSWICAVFALVAACSHEKPYEKPRTPVTVQTVEEYSGETRPVFSGSIEPMTRVDAAFRAGGYVQEIASSPGGGGLLKEGDFVRKGAVLARLRPADSEVKVSQARSQLEQSVAALSQAHSGVQAMQVSRDKAKQDLDRATRLFAAESLTKPDYEGAKAAFDAAEQNVRGAQSQVEAAKARIEGAKAVVSEAQLAFTDAVLHSPIDGVVYKRNVELGALVAPGTPAFTIADTRTVRVIFGAPDTLMGKLRIGQALPLTTEALPGTEFQGRISRISPMADPRSRVFDIEVTVPNAANRLRAGMIASLEAGESRTTQRVPVVALTSVVRAKDQPSSYAVYVVNDGAQPVVRRREVTLGEAFGNRVAVVNGVRAGERVVVTGASLIRDGEAVQVVPQTQVQQ